MLVLLHLVEGNQTDKNVFRKSTEDVISGKSPNSKEDEKARQRVNKLKVHIKKNQEIQ